MLRYEKDKLIGSGTYGNVWLVKSKFHRIPYVMKEIKLTSMNASEKQQALSEVSILSKCKHNNIIGYRDAIVDHNKGFLAIIMEYADGGDLHSAIANQKGVPFKEPLILSWFVQICLALQYIHFQNILHRDLKSQNIFITRAKVIKVGDFGIARLLQGPRELAKTAIGTPYYLSPEICLRKPYDHKSDIWALGCVLFEMAALTYPFQASSFPDLVSLILKGQRRDLPKHCSPLIEELVQNMLSLKPENRPSTDEVLELPALQQYLFEYRTVHSSKMHGLLTQSRVEKTRRNSLSGMFKKNEQTTLKRRLSDSSASSSARSPKLKSRKDKDPLRLKTSSPFNARIQGRKIYKPSPLANIGKDEMVRRTTYRVALRNRNLSPTKRTAPFQIIKNMLSSGSFKRYKVEKKPSPPIEPDNGYQTSDTKTISGKIEIKSACDSLRKSLKAESSTSANSVISNDDPTVLDVFFPTDTAKKSPGSSENATAGHICHHLLHCHQCMLDMLWKNRIRGQERTVVDSNERSKLATQLQSVFSGDLFNSVYQEFVDKWDGNELEISQNSFQNILTTLTYNQVQNLPLMMQLIQLDKILNFERAE